MSRTLVDHFLSEFEEEAATTVACWNASQVRLLEQPLPSIYGPTADERPFG